jgi:hypothetical protein
LVDEYEDYNYFGKVSFPVVLKVSKWNKSKIKENNYRNILYVENCIQWRSAFQ